MKVLWHERVHISHDYINISLSHSGNNIRHIIYMWIVNNLLFDHNKPLLIHAFMVYWTWWLLMKTLGNEYTYKRQIDQTSIPCTYHLCTIQIHCVLCFRWRSKCSIYIYILLCSIYKSSSRDIVPNSRDF